MIEYALLLVLATPKPTNQSARQQRLPIGTPTPGTRRHQSHTQYVHKLYFRYITYQMKRNNLTHDDTRSSCYDSITIHTLVVFLNKWRLTELTGLRVTRILLVFYNKGCGGVLVWFWNNLPQISREGPWDCQTDPYGSREIPSIG